MIKNKIKQTYTNKGFSRADIADALAVTSQNMFALEKSKNPTVESLVRLSTILECNWWELVTDEEPTDYIKVPIFFSIRNRIREVRERKKITSMQMYTALEVHQGNYSRTENPTRIPSMDRLFKIAKILKCNIKDLIEIKEDVVKMESLASKTKKSLLEKAKKELQGEYSSVTELEFCAALGYTLALLEKYNRNQNGWKIVRHGIVNEHKKEKMRDKLVKNIRPHLARIAFEEEPHVKQVVAYIISYIPETHTFSGEEHQAFLFAFLEKK